MKISPFTLTMMRSMMRSRFCAARRRDGDEQRQDESDCFFIDTLRGWSGSRNIRRINILARHQRLAQLLEHLADPLEQPARRSRIDRPFRQNGSPA